MLNLLLLRHVLLFQDLVHLSRRSWTLKLLTVQQLILQLFNSLKHQQIFELLVVYFFFPSELMLRLSYFACFGKSLPDFAVASAVAGGDEVGDAAALQEGGGGDGAVGAEELGEGDHLHQAEADHRRLGVVAEAQAVAETGSHGYDVLQHHSKERKVLPL